MSEATVAASMLRALLVYLDESGLDAPALAQRAGAHRLSLQHGDRPVAASHYRRLMQQAIEASHNPLLGLEFGMAATPQRWGTFGELLRHCATLGEVLDFQARYAHLVNSLGQGRLIRAGSRVAIEWQATADVAPAFVEEAFAAWVRFARWASDRPGALAAVAFSHRAQGDPAIYRAFFDCPVDFNAARSRLYFDPALLDAPLRAPDAQMTAALSERVAEHQHWRDAHETASRLRHWLRKRLPQARPTLAEAADALDTSERSLQHRLQIHGTSFRDSVDTARRELAEHYLANARLSVGDIALRLGFSEQSAFQRAFRRWHGVTPLAWRRNR